MLITAPLLHFNTLQIYFIGQAASMTPRRPSIIEISVRRMTNLFGGKPNEDRSSFRSSGKIPLCCYFYTFLASEKGLLTVMILTAICTVIFSFQMTVDEPSMLNAISMTILFAFVRTLFYIVKSLVSLLKTFKNMLSIALSMSLSQNLFLTCLIYADISLK